jgi:hypothetical protein
MFCGRVHPHLTATTPTHSPLRSSPRSTHTTRIPPHPCSYADPSTHNLHSYRHILTHHTTYTPTPSHIRRTLSHTSHASATCKNLFDFALQKRLNLVTVPKHTGVCAKATNSHYMLIQCCPEMVVSIFLNESYADRWCLCCTTTDHTPHHISSGDTRLAIKFVFPQC